MRYFLIAVTVAIAGIAHAQSVRWSESAKAENGKAGYRWQKWMSAEIKRLRLPTDYFGYCQARSQEISDRESERLERTFEHGVPSISVEPISNVTAYMISRVNEAAARGTIVCLSETSRLAPPRQ